ncbi:MAG: YegP family protein [Fimbriimonadales bacterium]
MVFLIEKIKGSWFWRLKSTLFRKVVATSHGTDTKKECLAEIAVIKKGAAEATIQLAEGGLVLANEEPSKTSEKPVP